MGNRNQRTNRKQHEQVACNPRDVGGVVVWKSYVPDLLEMLQGAIPGLVDVTEVESCGGQVLWQRRIKHVLRRRVARGQHMGSLNGYLQLVDVVNVGNGAVDMLNAKPQ